MNIEIANRLVNLRKENNLSQEALAEKIGISRQAVSKWERAEASPDTDNLILLSRLYGVSLDELLKTDDEIPMPEADEAAGSQSEADSNSGIDGDSVKTAGNSTSYDSSTSNGGRQNYVNIGRDGIHVQSEDGDEVHINWSGIHVRENGGSSANVGWNGIHVFEDGENDGYWKNKEGASNSNRWDGIHLGDDWKDTIWTANSTAKNGMYEEREPKVEFPTGALVSIGIFIGYLLLGIFYHEWLRGLVFFLLIPVFTTIVEAINRRDITRFAYPVLVTFIFLVLGVFYGNWMGWIAFLTIPIYYVLANYFKSLARHRKWKKQKEAAEMKYKEEE